MEELIVKLLANDCASINEATNELKEAYKRPEAIQQLCELVLCHEENRIRQYASMLLRTALWEQNNWENLSVEQQAVVKQTMLEALLREQHRTVRNAIARTVATMLYSDTDSHGAVVENILKNILENICSEDAQQCERAAAVFASLADHINELLEAHMLLICEIFNAAMTRAENSGNMSTPIVLHVVQGMTQLVSYSVGNTLAEQTFQRALPGLICTAQAFAQPEHTIGDFLSVFDMLEDLVEYIPKVLTQQLRSLVELCLHTCSNQQIQVPKRVKVAAYLGSLAQYKRSMLIKLNLVEPIIQLMFQLLLTPPTDDSDDFDDYFSDESSNSLVSVATQTLNKIALHIPTDKLLPPLLQLLEPVLQSEDVLVRRATLLAIAVVAEGCSKLIINKYLDTMLAVIKSGIFNKNMLVRNAAFFAMGQFSAYLQPEISNYAQEILPILFAFLEEAYLKDKTNTPGQKQVERVFYALEVFCENMDQDKLKPYLPPLMEKLFEAMNPSNTTMFREQALRVIESVIIASKENFMPYFNDLIALLRPYLVKTGDKNIVVLRKNAMDTLSVVAVHVGKQNFMPIAQDAMQFAIELLDEVDDPEDKCSIYSLFRAMAEVFKEDLKAIFPKIMDNIYYSVLTADEILPKDRMDGDDTPGLEIDILDSDNESDDADDFGYDIENFYTEEKAEAILALGDFAKHCGEAFLPHLEQAYENVHTMLSHPVEHVRMAAVSSCVEILVQMYKNRSDQVNRKELDLFVIQLNDMLRDEIEPAAAVKIINGLVTLLNELKGFIVPNEISIKFYISILDDVLSSKLKCQNQDQCANDEYNEENDYDEFTVIEDAGDILPALGKALTPEIFLQYFDMFCPRLLFKLEKSNRNDDDSSFSRFFVFGVFADCFKPLGHFAANYFDTLMPYMLRFLNDKCERVRQNVVYGLGELVFHSGPKSYDSFPSILQELSKAVSQESKPAVRDNICSAIARLILTNHKLVPLAQVLPALFNFLPLREDFNENAVMFECFKHLYMVERELFLQYFDQVVLMSIQVLYKQQYEKNEETRATIMSLLNELHLNYAEKFKALLISQTPAEQAEFLQKLFA